MRVWKVALGDKAFLWNECFNGGYICIGWDEEIGNIKNYSDYESLLDSLGPGDNGGKRTNDASSLWSFCNEILIGDIIIANSGKSEVKGVGIVTGNYLSTDSLANPRKSEDGYLNVRNVYWLKDIKKISLSNKKFDIKAVTELEIDDERISSIFLQNNYSLDKLLNDRKNVLRDLYIMKIKDILKFQKQIILQGPPGTGKTRLAKQLARYLVTGKYESNIEGIDDISDYSELIQFHPSYSYEDFVRGIVAKSNGKQVEYITENKTFINLTNKANNSIEKNYVLIIDEINRANLSTVLGELIYALEYRGEPVQCMYDIDGSREIIIPSNLYIIGTMNTADRSIGHMDYAIRRRFTFIDILPDEKIVNDNSKFIEVKKLFINDDGENADTLSPEFDPNKVMIGHSYFMADSDDELQNKLKYQVIPLLNEYVEDGILNEAAKKIINNINDDD